ncbi:MAG TPA: alpha/beta hydrolase [Oculatellaceae cyanobacterium]
MKTDLLTDIESAVNHGYLENNGVKIHYASLGTGPLVLFVHGFPDYWYTWRNQMLSLSEHFQTVAIDLRGYNLSDKPAGRDQYQMQQLVSDIVAVGRHFQKKLFALVGHDWGGAISWCTAMAAPDLIERLVICNSHHPATMRRELEHSPEQQKASSYAKLFKIPGAHRKVTMDDLVKWIEDPAAKEKYVEAFGRSDVEAMISYYQNYPDFPNVGEPKPFPKIKCPVLHLHGLDDQFILPGGLDGTWQWVDNEYTLVTIPGAGHFVQHDASASVSKHLKKWLVPLD